MSALVRMSAILLDLVIVSDVVIMVPRDLNYSINTEYDIILKIE